MGWGLSNPAASRQQLHQITHYTDTAPMASLVLELDTRLQQEAEEDSIARGSAKQAAYIHDLVSRNCAAVIATTAASSSSAGEDAIPYCGSPPNARL